MVRPSIRCLQALSRNMARNKSISAIGVGRMGSEMAFNLFSKTFTDAHDARFVVCDAVVDSAHVFKQNFLSHFPTAQIHIVATPEEAVQLSQTVITMLPSSPQVRTVYSESAGIIPTLRSLPENIARSTLCIDSTTLAVDVARAVAYEVIQAGAQMIDAPVSGGVVGAKAGTLAFLVGGTEEAHNAALPSLRKMGKHIFHCGESGLGLVAKICNNLVLGVEQIVVAEAMLLGQELGLDAASLARVINSSTGGCWASSFNNPVPFVMADHTPPCENNYEGGFSTALMLKDMGLACRSGSSCGIRLPLGEAAESIYREVIKQCPELEKKDFSSVFVFLKKAAANAKLVA